MALLKQSPLGETIKAILEEAQRSSGAHQKLIDRLKKTYGKSEEAKFHSNFSHFLMFAMIVGEKNPYVERLVNFAMKFVLSLSAKSKGEDGGKDCEGEKAELVNSYLPHFLKWLCKLSISKDKAIRFRACEFLHKMLSAMPNDETIDDNLFAILVSSLLERIQDKVPAVRVQSVYALSRLQSPSDPNCEVTKAYKLHMQNDPHPNVRKAVLQVIAPTSTILEYVVERTRDCRDIVRKEAYIYLAHKVSVRALSISKRERLLREGLSDRSDMVRNIVRDQVVPAWLNRCKGDIFSLLEALDVTNGDEEVPEHLLDAHFSHVSNKELVECLVKFMDQKLICLESLTPERVIYWRFLVKYLSEQGAGDASYLQDILPEMIIYAEYLRNYVLEQQPIAGSAQDIFLWEFICTQLLKLASIFDFSDEFGRQKLVKTLQEILLCKRMGHRLVTPLIVCYSKAQLIIKLRVEELLQLVNEILEPTREAESVPHPSEAMLEQQKKDIKIKIAKLRVEIETLKDDMNQAMANAEWDKVDSIRDGVKVRVETVKKLEAENATLISAPASVPQQSKEVSSAVRSMSLLKSLLIIDEMLRNISLKEPFPEAANLVDDVILSAVQDEDPIVRKVAVDALGQCCLRCFDLAQKNIILLHQVASLDHETVRVAAIEGLFSFLLWFGPHRFQSIDKMKDGKMESEDNSWMVETEKDVLQILRGERDKIPSSFVGYALSLMDDANAKVRRLAVLQACKLLFNNLICSPLLLSHLLLLWANPATEDDPELRNTLGVFFEVFVAHPEHLQQIEEALIPSLSAIWNAPSLSPLCQLDVEDFVAFLIELTRGSGTTADNVVHKSWAFKICNLIVQDPDGEETDVDCLVRALCKLQMPADDHLALRDLHRLMRSLIENVQEKRLIRTLTKVEGELKELLKAHGENEISSSSLVEEGNESIGDTHDSSARHSKTRILFDSTSVTCLDRSSLAVEGTPFVGKSPRFQVGGRVVPIDDEVFIRSTPGTCEIEGNLDSSIDISSFSLSSSEHTRASHVRVRGASRGNIEKKNHMSAVRLASHAEVVREVASGEDSEVEVTVVPESETSSLEGNEETGQSVSESEAAAVTESSEDDDMIPPSPPKPWKLKRQRHTGKKGREDSLSSTPAPVYSTRSLRYQFSQESQ